MEIRRVCRAMVKTLEKKTCQAVKDYYRNILANDLIYPHRIERLHHYMRTGAETDKANALFCIHCKCGFSRIEDDENRTTTRRKNRPKPLLDDPLPPNDPGKADGNCHDEATRQERQANSHHAKAKGRIPIRPVRSQIPQRNLETRRRGQYPLTCT